MKLCSKNLLSAAKFLPPAHIVRWAPPQRIAKWCFAGSGGSCPLIFPAAGSDTTRSCGSPAGRNCPIWIHGISRWRMNPPIHPENG